jgi:ABC-type antimicrobial peptide transport system permease subunit
MLYPLVLLGWIGFLLMTLVLIVLSFLLGFILYRIAVRRFPGETKRRLRKKYQWNFDKPGIWSRWNFSWGCIAFTLTLLPSVVIATAVACLVAFHPIRKKLVSFLVTRPSWAGAGWLDSKKQLFHSTKTSQMHGW